MRQPEPAAVPWSDWVGRSETREDQIGSTPLHALLATLDRAPQPMVPGTPLPPLWHWLYFVPMPRASEIGPDGHARRGGFLPPVPQSRRMWAGGRFEFLAPVCVGDTVRRRSTIESIVTKPGRAGPLVFVTVRHEFLCNGMRAPALREWHDIVYRDADRPGDAGSGAAPARPAPDAAASAPWQREWTPDEVMLFRYSALTFNGHRIHYDRRYVTEVEGYPGLVVHGPLIATLLLELVHEHDHTLELASFSFRALRPCFDGRRLRVAGAPQGDGRQILFWATDDSGALAMSAEATLR